MKKFVSARSTHTQQIISTVHSSKPEPSESKSRDGEDAGK